MKYSTLFCVVIVVLTSLFASTSSAVLVDRYSFTTGDGTTAVDSVGGQNGTLVNGATISGNKVTLSGSSSAKQHVNLPGGLVSSYTSATIESWFTCSSSSGNWTRLFDFGASSGANGGYYLFFSPKTDASHSRFVISNTTPGYNYEQMADASQIIPTSVVKHVVCVYDGAAGSMKFYVDGVLWAENNAVTIPLSTVATDYAYLGRSLYSADSYMAGSIDDFRIYDSVLTPTQIQQNYEWGPDVIASSKVTITETDGSTTIYTGGQGTTDTYQIQLAQQPTASVVITVDPPAELNLGTGAGTPVQLTFTASNQPQTITVAAANPQTPQELIARIQHTSASSDSNFNAINIYDIGVDVLSAECGALGYLEADYNLDCYVNLHDFVLLAQVWLETDVLLELDPLAGDWLKTTMMGEEGAVEGPVQKSIQPFAVNTANVLNTIDEKVYGHFLEHIYHSANGGLWGELVWNRSFESYGNNGQGIWSIDGTELVQSSLATDVRLLFGDTSWQNYEISLEAKKTGGNEGFLIMFRANGNNYYWLNLGGWGNTKHAIEKSTGGSRGIVGTEVPGSITTDQWYNIHIRCEDGRYQVWLDSSLIIDYTDSSPHLSGQVGVGTWATQARFRNIQVTRISDSQVLFSGLPAIPSSQYISDFWTSFGNGQITAQMPDALNGDYCVLLAATGGQTVGVEQTPFKFTTQSYSGSLWAKGSVPGGILVQMLDGETVLGQATLSAPTSIWQEYSFQITPSAEAIPGMLRISLIGAGSVYIDQVSMMGQDAIDTGGYRPDLLEAVEGLRPPVIRWPGGCYASAYFWKDGIGHQENRVKYPINLWDDQDTNSYGTDEFLRMCEQIGAEPLICINTGLLNGTCGVAIPSKLTPEQYLQDALDWMEYCNGSTSTTWGAARAANGHPAPYNVKYWEIDNETWSTSWGGGITNYIAKVQAFVPAMQTKAVELGFPIEISAVGGGSYDMGWNQSLIDACASLIDYISVHHYEGSGGYKTGPAAYDGFLTTLANAIAGSANPNMKIYNSEWNLQTTDWRTGLYAGGILNVYERHGADFKIGGPALFLRHTSATGWDNAFINFDHTGWFAAPNYIVMKLWHDHYAPNRVETTGTDTDLNVVSTLSEDETTLNFKIVNPTATARSMALVIDNSFVPATAYLHYVAPGSLDDRNTLASTDTVRVQAKVVGINGQTIRFLLPAYSAGVVTVHSNGQLRVNYLFSYFKGSGDGLHLARSTNGLTWTALNNDATLLTPTIGGGLFRDPCVTRGPDGTFHMVWTTGWWDKGIGIAHSPDLINWPIQTFLPVMQNEANAKNCWAPEIFYDEENQRYLIFWATTIDGAFPETYNPSDDNNHRIYYVSTQDFVTYTPTALFYDPGFNCIDATIVKDGVQYVMFLKNETKVPVAQKNIRMATAVISAAGPYVLAPAPISPAGLWAEGPTAMKIGQDWYLYYDEYTLGKMGGQKSSDDMQTWQDITSQLSFPSGVRHGTIFTVPTNILIPLQQL